MIIHYPVLMQTSIDPQNGHNLPTVYTCICGYTSTDRKEFAVSPSGIPYPQKVTCPAYKASVRQQSAGQWDTAIKPEE